MGVAFFMYGPWGIPVAMVFSTRERRTPLAMVSVTCGRCDSRRLASGVGNLICLPGRVLLITPGGWPFGRIAAKLGHTIEPTLDDYHEGCLLYTVSRSEWQTMSGPSASPGSDKQSTGKHQ